jgi:ATP-dependent DNA ligase
MLAKRVGELPVGGTWIFEPKWDGFRALVFRDGEEILIQSRDEKSLNRYFPELLDPLRSMLPARCVLDGEIVVAGIPVSISRRSSSAFIRPRRA